MSEDAPSSATDPPITSGIERRASTRYPCNLATSCRLVALVPGNPVPGKVRNISIGGMSLVLNKPFDSGVEVAVEMRSHFRRLSQTLHVRVCYCVEHPSGDWIVGAAFTQPLSEDEVRLLLI